MKHLMNFEELNESLPRNKSVEQMKMVRKLSKGTDIGDRISDMNDEGANLHYMYNAIDKGIESHEDYEKNNRAFIPGWNFKGLTDPFTGNKKPKKKTGKKKTI